MVKPTILLSFLALIFCSSLVCGQAIQQVPFSLVISEQLRNTFTLVGSGARAAGMGGAFTAVADDATAASFNPAGLAQLVVPEASVVFDRIHLKDQYRNFFILDKMNPGEPPQPVTDSDTEFNRNDLNFLSFTVPFQMGGRGWAAQFSTQEAVDLTYHGDRRFSELDSLRNPVADIRQKSDQSGGIRVYSGSLAISATQRMLLGITVNRWKGDWTFVSHNAETPLDDPGAAEFLTYTQTNSLSAWNVDLGMLLRYKYANVGIRYRTGFSADYGLAAQLDTNVAECMQAFACRPLPDTKTRLHWPSTLNIGVAVKPSDRLTVAADYGRTNWSKMLFDNPLEKGTVNFFDLGSPKSTLVSTARDWRIGAEYLFFFRSAILPVRAGWIYEPQPGVDIATGKRIISKGYTAGAGIKIGWFAVDFAYQRKTSTTSITLFEPDDLVTGDTSNPSVGTVRRSENRLFVSTIVQLPKSTSLRHVIHVIFVGPKTSSS